MAKHRRIFDKRKVAPSLILAFAVFSITSPLILLLFSPTATAPLAEATLPITSSSSSSSIAQTQGPVPVQQSQSKARTSTTKPVPTARTTTSSSTKTSPSTTKKQVQRTTTSTTSTTSTTTTVRRPPSTTASRPQTTAQRTAVAVTQPSTTTTTTPTSTTSAKSTTTQTQTQTTSSDPPKALPPSHQLVAQVAQKYVGRGIPYLLGGNSLTSGMDCSHFIWMVLKEAGYNVPYRDSGGLAAWTANTRTTSPSPGDLVLYRGHAGIYVGNGKMVGQGKPGGAHLQSVYTQNFIGYGRIPL